jgi:hypothetical protein
MRGSFTCRKVGTWYRLFNFPSEGRHAEDFYIQKNPTRTDVILIAGIHPSRLANLDINLVMEIRAACELLVHALTATFFREVTKSAY